MERKSWGQRGMSLVEVTIILMTLAILTAVAAPSIGDYVSEARQTKAKEDVEALGTGLVRMVRDIGGGCVRLSGAAGCTLANRVEILRSGGPDVVTADLASTATNYAAPAGSLVGATNWNDDQGTRSDTFDNQLVLNNPDYDIPPETTPSGYTVSGPSVVGIGWRGAYMAPIGTDPWGKPYLSNVVFFRVAADAPAGTGEGQQSGGWARDAIVISAGANGLFDTAYGGSANGGTERLSDDVIYVISGDTR
jgi:type II secretory pathway pseudopilin PulG